jgi:hypothetical protein
MITLQKCNTRRGFAVDEMSRAACNDVERRRVSCSLRAPIGHFAGIGLPIDVRTGEKIRALVIRIHELENKKCGSVDCISTRAILAHAADSKPNARGSRMKSSPVEATSDDAAAKLHMVRQLVWRVSKFRRRLGHSRIELDP